MVGTYINRGGGHFTPLRVGGGQTMTDFNPNDPGFRTLHRHFLPKISIPLIQEFLEIRNQQKYTLVQFGIFSGKKINLGLFVGKNSKIPQKDFKK